MKLHDFCDHVAPCVWSFFSAQQNASLFLCFTTRIDRHKKCFTWSEVFDDKRVIHFREDPVELFLVMHVQFYLQEDALFFRTEVANTFVPQLHL